MRVQIFGVVLAILCACAMFAQGGESVVVQVKGKSVAAAPCGPQGCPIPARSFSLHLERHSIGFAAAPVRGMFARVATVARHAVRNTLCHIQSRVATVRYAVQSRPKIFVRIRVR